MPCIGVDISDTSLKYVELVPDHYTGKDLELKSWGDIAIPEGALQRGVVNDVGKLAEALRAVRDKTGAELIRASLPEERAYIFETSIERSTSKKEIRGLLEFKLEENVPLSPQDAFFDYEVLNGFVTEEAMRVLVTVYARETIMNYYEAIRVAGMTPLSFEVEAQAIARATIINNDLATHMVVDFGKTRTGIGIVQAGSLVYASTIDIGGERLSNDLRAVVGDLTEAELIIIKNSQGLLGSGDATTVLTTAVEKITDELKVRVDYWNRQQINTAAEIESIILCGGSVNLKGFPESVTQALGIPAERADVWKNVYHSQEHIPDIEKRFSYSYATAIGLNLASYL